MKEAKVEPVHVELREDAESGRELDSEERGRLEGRDIPSSERSELGASWQEARSMSQRSRRVFGCRTTSAGAPTCLSILRSHMSLIVHPAPRMSRAPVPKRAVYQMGVETGAAMSVEARMMDQAG